MKKKRNYAKEEGLLMAFTLLGVRKHMVYFKDSQRIKVSLENPVLISFGYF